MAEINTDFEFSKNWEDNDDFPTRETSEKQVRQDIQLLFDELKDHLNGVVHSAVNDLYSRVAAVGGGGHVEHEAIGDNAVDSNNLADNAVTTEKLEDNSVTADKLDESVMDELNASLETAVDERSSKLTLLKTDSVNLYKPTSELSGTSSDEMESSKTIRIPFTELGFNTRPPMNRLLVLFWATPTGINLINSPAPYFKYAHGLSVASVDLYMENTYSGSANTFTIVGHYAIYLIEE